jgi:hypothetical protein
MCELNEPVDERTLQEALDAVIADFPHLKCVLHKGLFWYYLDYRDIRAIVSNENLNACSALYYGGPQEPSVPRQLFRKQNKSRDVPCSGRRHRRFHFLQSPDNKVSFTSPQFSDY